MFTSDNPGSGRAYCTMLQYTWEAQSMEKRDHWDPESCCSILLYYIDCEITYAASLFALDVAIYPGFS